MTTGQNNRKRCKAKKFILILKILQNTNVIHYSSEIFGGITLISTHSFHVS